MINKNLLKATCFKQKLTISDLAERLEIDETALYEKINGTSDFNRGEIISIGQILSLTQTDVDAIFFNNDITKTQDVAIENKPVLSATEAAAYSGIGLNTLRSWAFLASRGKMAFPCFWVGDYLKIPRQAFDAWLNKMGEGNVSLPSSVEMAGRRR